MDRAGARDPDAFAALVRPHMARLYRYALRMCGDPDAASDIAQDALLRAFERIASYDPARPVLPWLITLVRHAFVDRVRSFDPLRGADEAEGEGPLPSRSDPVDQASHAETANAIEGALKELPVDQRSCVVLYHVEGRSLEEISESEGVPIGTVKSRLFRGRQALAERLGHLA